MVSLDLHVRANVSMLVRHLSVAMVRENEMNNVMMETQAIQISVQIPVLPWEVQDLLVVFKLLILMDQFLSRPLSLVLVLNQAVRSLSSQKIILS